jgi:hypothetical protein
MTGRVFGRWTVIARGGRYRSQRKWICVCACGQQAEVLGDNLRSGHSQSCGCLMRERVGNATRTHGDHKSPEWQSWTAMINRCERPSHKQFKDYGGRGITVCRRWREDYSSFLADMGRKPTPNLTIDRINNDGNYEPTNCRWATRFLQNTNRRRSFTHYNPDEGKPI